MTALNYQTPSGFTESVVWAQGNRLHARSNSMLPARCIACNSAENLKWKNYNLTWCTPLAYLALLGGLLPAIIVILIVQQKAKLQFATCKQCRKKLLTQKLIAWGIFFACLTSFGAAIGYENGYLALLGLAFLFASMIYAIIKCHLYSVAKIESNVVILKGLSPNFLGSLDQR